MKKTVIWILFFLFVTIFPVAGVSVLHSDVYARESLNKVGQLINSANVKLYNITGAANAVCIIDSGVDYTHSYLGGCSLFDISVGNCSTVIGGYNFINLSEDPMDDRGHGTDMAGIFISNHQTYFGISPGSKLIALKVINSKGVLPRDQLLIDAINWCIDNSSRFNISTILISMNKNFAIPQALCPDDLSSAVSNAVASNLTVVISSGNSGYPYGTNFPACAPDAFVVGSTYSYDGQFEGNCKDTARIDKQTCFTNNVPTLKILAPGANIVSTDLDNDFAVYYGTSESAAIVAASSLLLQEFLGPLYNQSYAIYVFNKTGINVLGSSLKRIDIQRAIDLIPFFDVFYQHWPTFHHDYRRTGFTIAKGDVRDSTKQVTWQYDEFNETSDHFDSPVIGNILNNKFSYFDVAEPDELVVGTFGENDNNIYGRVYALQRGIFDLLDGGSYLGWYWGFSGKGQHVLRAPVIADLDNDGQNEVVFSSYDTTYALNGDGTQRWNVTVVPPMGPMGEPFDVDIQGLAIADINLDGTAEIVMTDYANVDVSVNWKPKIYVYNETDGVPVQICSVEIPDTNQKRGVNDYLSLADLDGDSKLDIIAPTRYGVFVYNSSCQLMWNSTLLGIIANAAAIADVDRDNSYEIVFSTVDACSGENLTCHNYLYVFSANGSIESTFNVEYYPWTTPAIGNIDDDVQLEIVFGTTDNWAEYPNVSEFVSIGLIYVYDPVKEIIEYSYTLLPSGDAVYSSPDIADIDNDGTYEIIFGTYNGSLVVLNRTGSDLVEEWRINVGGNFWSAPAIGDLDGDGFAEIAAKHQGSEIMAVFGGFNTPPFIETMENITVNATQLVSVRPLFDDYTDDETVELIYGIPLDNEGDWQTTGFDAGNYSLIVGVSDGEMTNYQYVFAQVLPFSTNIYFDYPTPKDGYFTSHEQNWSIFYLGVNESATRIILQFNQTNYSLDSSLVFKSSFTDADMNDSSGYSIPAYGNNNVSDWCAQEGRFGEGCWFNGSSADNRYVSYGDHDHLELNNTDFCFLAWVKPSGWGQGGFGRIADKRGTSGNGWSVRVESTGRLYFESNGNVRNSDANALHFNDWQQIAVSYNRSAQLLTFYVNNTQRGTASLFTSEAPAASSTSMFVGIRADLNREFEGLIDEMEIRTEQCTPSLINQHYQYWYGPNFINLTGIADNTTVFNYSAFATLANGTTVQTLTRTIGFGHPPNTAPQLNVPRIYPYALNSSVAEAYCKPRYLRDKDNQSVANLTVWKVNNQTQFFLMLPFDTEASVQTSGGANFTDFSNHNYTFTATKNSSWNALPTLSTTTFKHWGRGLTFSGEGAYVAKAPAELDTSYQRVSAFTIVTALNLSACKGDPDDGTSHIVRHDVWPIGGIRITTWSDCSIVANTFNKTTMLSNVFTEDITPGQPTYLALVFETNQTSGQYNTTNISLYVNGEFKEKMTDVPYNPIQTAQLVIGRDWSGATSSINGTLFFFGIANYSMTPAQIAELNESFNLTSSFGSAAFEAFDVVECESAATDSYAEGTRLSSQRAVEEPTIPFFINFTDSVLPDLSLMNNTVNNFTVSIVHNKGVLDAVTCMFNNTNYSLPAGCGPYPCTNTSITFNNIVDNFTTFEYRCFANNTAGNRSETDLRRVKFGMYANSCFLNGNCHLFQLFDYFDGYTDGAYLAGRAWADANWTNFGLKKCVARTSGTFGTVAECPDTSEVWTSPYNIKSNTTYSCQVSAYVDKVDSYAVRFFGFNNAAQDVFYEFLDNGAWKYYDIDYKTLGVEFVSHTWYDLAITQRMNPSQGGTLGCDYYVHLHSNDSWFNTSSGCHYQNSNKPVDRLELWDYGGILGNVYFDNLSCWNGTMNQKPYVR